MNELYLLKTDSKKVLFCARIAVETGHATIYMDDVTPERLRELAAEMEAMNG